MFLFLLFKLFLFAFLLSFCFHAEQLYLKCILQKKKKYNNYSKMYFFYLYTNEMQKLNCKKNLLFLYYMYLKK